MSLQTDNKELVRRIMEDGFNQQDLSVIDDSFHDDYVRRGYGMKDAGSLAQHRADLIAQHEAIRDAKFTIQQVLAEGDTVAVYFVLTGEAKRSGSHVEQHLAAFFRVAQGRVAEGTVITTGWEP